MLKPSPVSPKNRFSVSIFTSKSNVRKT
jgi:hypothetical protein